MEKRILIVILTYFMVGCGTSKKRTYSNSPVTVSVANTAETPNINTTIESSSDLKTTYPKIADAIVSKALEYTGVRYKYGGNNSKGMDCSGLLHVAFTSNEVAIPRVSYVIAEKGHSIAVSNVLKGDLLFFKTNRKSKKINHVGLVVSTKNDEIQFIHATTSRGVIVSSLREGYWNSAFVKATRIL